MQTVFKSVYTVFSLKSTRTLFLRLAFLMQVTAIEAGLLNVDKTWKACREPNSSCNFIDLELRLCSPCIRHAIRAQTDERDCLANVS